MDISKFIIPQQIQKESPNASFVTMDTSACLDSFHTFISKTFYLFNQVSNYESIDIISIIV